MSSPNTIPLVCDFCGATGGAKIDTDLPLLPGCYFPIIMPEGWITGLDPPHNLCNGYFCSRLCKAKKGVEQAEKELREIEAEEGE